MANLHFTGFNGITTAQITRRYPSAIGAALTVDAAYGRFGPGLHIANTANAFHVGVAGAPSTLFVGFHWKPLATWTGEREIFQFRDSGGFLHAIVYYNGTTGKIIIKGAAGSVTLITSTATLSLGTWYWIEVGLHVHDSTGTAELRIDGVVDGTASGADTKHGSSTGVDFVSFGNSGASMDLDNLYINDNSGSAPDNTFWGELRVDPLLPAADSAVQFVPLSSTNKSNIDDGNAPDDDTTYNESSTPGDVDLFTVSGYLAPSPTILGVVVRAVAKKTDSGARTFRPKLKSSATTANGTTAALSTTYQEFSQYLPQDPATSAAWADAAAVNAALIGYECVA